MGELSDERAVRLLRTKVQTLEFIAAAYVDGRATPDVGAAIGNLAADVALIADLLADHIERSVQF